MRHAERPRRLGDPRRGRRDPAPRAHRGRRAGHLLVGRLALGPGAPGQPARVPDAALRRRRAAPPRRARCATCTCGTTTTGSARCRHGVDPSCAEHIGRPLVAVPDPWGCHDSWSDALQGAAARRARTRWASRWRRSRRPSATAPASTATRCCAPYATAREIDAVLAQHRTKKAEPAAERRARRAGGRGDGRLGRRRRRGRRRRAPASAASRSSPTAATAAATPPRSRRTTTRPPTSPTPARSATTTAPPTSRRRTRASWSGRSTGRCAGPSSTSTSSRPAWTTRRPGRRSPSATSWSRRSSGLPRPAWFGYGFVGFAGVQKMSSSAGGAPTAEDALRVLEAPILRWLYVRRQPKQTFDIDFGPEVVRLYDEWDALARKAADPDKRDAQVLAYERAVGDRAAGPLPAPAVVVPFRLLVLGRRRDRRLGRADQPDRRHIGHAHDSVDDLEPRLSRAMAWTARVRRRRPTAPTVRDDARRRPRSRRCRRPASASGSRCCSTGCRAELELDAGDRAGLRRAQAGARAGPRRQADRRGEGGPEGVLPAALPPARRRRARPAAADAGRGARAPSGCGRCSAPSPAARRTPRGWSRAGTPSSAPTRRSSPIARAAERRAAARQRRKPRLGSCSHGTGPWPFQPLRRSRSRLRW